MEHHFNVYDCEWNFIDEFWSADDWGLKIGDYKKYAAKMVQIVNTKYKITIYIKRMS